MNIVEYKLIFKSRMRKLRYPHAVVFRSFLKKCLIVFALVQLTACTTSPGINSTEISSLNSTLNDEVPLVSKQGLTAPHLGKWQHYQFPGKRPTAYFLDRVDGRDVVGATANVSASMLRQRVRVEPADLGIVKFSWKVAQLIAQADMALQNADDSPVRVILAFEGDRSLFSLKNSMLSELTHVMTGEPLPYATLMYVWCNTRSPGSVIVDPRTDRIRKIVVESGVQGLNQWLNYERNIYSDFEQTFGESPGALVGIGIMTDADNTNTNINAWYGQIDLLDIPANGFTSMAGGSRR